MGNGNARPANLNDIQDALLIGSKPRNVTNDLADKTHTLAEDLEGRPLTRHVKQHRHHTVHDHDVPPSSWTGGPCPSGAARPGSLHTPASRARATAKREYDAELTLLQANSERLCRGSHF